MGKKYLDTKKSTIEAAVLDVWNSAAEEQEAIHDAARMIVDDTIAEKRGRGRRDYTAVEWAKLSPAQREKILHPDRPSRAKDDETKAYFDSTKGPETYPTGDIGPIKPPKGTGIGGQPSVKEILPAQKPTKDEKKTMQRAMKHNVGMSRTKFGQTDDTGAGRSSPGRAQAAAAMSAAEKEFEKRQKVGHTPGAQAAPIPTAPKPKLVKRAGIVTGPELSDKDARALAKTMKPSMPSAPPTKKPEKPKLDPMRYQGPGPGELSQKHRAPAPKAKPWKDPDKKKKKKDYGPAYVDPAYGKDFAGTQAQMSNSYQHELEVQEAIRNVAEMMVQEKKERKKGWFAKYVDTQKPGAKAAPAPQPKEPQKPSMIDAIKNVWKRLTNGDFIGMTAYLNTLNEDQSSDQIAVVIGDINETALTLINPENLDQTMSINLENLQIDVNEDGELEIYEAEQPWKKIRPWPTDRYGKPIPK